MDKVHNGDNRGSSPKEIGSRVYRDHAKIIGTCNTRTVPAQLSTRNDSRFAKRFRQVY